MPVTCMDQIGFRISLKVPSEKPYVSAGLCHPVESLCICSGSCPGDDPGGVN